MPQRRKAIGYITITVLTTAATFIPFLSLDGGPWIIASFVALTKVGSWSTPWALIDGNWGPGDVGPLSTRTQLDLAGVPQAHPPVIPWIVTIGIFAIVYWLFFRRPIRTAPGSGASVDQRGAKELIWFATLTAMLFHLWSKGWSPQWATLIIPLLLLSFPDRRGLWLTLLLTGLVFLEWPISDALRSPALLAVAIIGRTLLFIAVAYLCAKMLWPATAADRSSLGKPPSLADYIQ